MKTLQHLGLGVARWGVVAMLVALPLSKALFNAALLLIIVGWVLSGGYRDKLLAMFRSPTARAAMVFVAALLASASYSSAPSEDIRYAAGIYLRLLIVPVIVSLILDDAWLRRCWVALIAGMTILLLHIYANVWFEIPWARSAAEQLGNRGVFNAHMVQSVSLAFFVAVLLNRFAQTRRPFPRWMFFLVATAAAVSITHLSDSRTGYFALLVALAIHTLLMVPKRWKLPALVGLIVSAGLVVAITPSVNERMNLAYEQATAYSQVIDHTSVGSRLYMWKVSAELMSQAPWFGHGLASYAHLAQRAFSDATLCSYGCQHPHNEYLFTGVQTGLVGLLLLLNLMIKPLQTWLKVDRKRSAVPIFVGLLALTAIPDGPLWFRGFAFFFIPVMGLLAADLQQQARKQTTLLPHIDGSEGVSKFPQPTTEGLQP
jgi:O-antigen ligase